MFGLIGAVIGWLSYHLGLRTDAASSTGSVHAKVKYLNDTTVPAVTTNVNAVVNTRQKPRGPVSAPISFQTSNAGWVTALNISGKGQLVGLYHALVSGGTGELRLTIDGYAFTMSASVSGACYLAKAWAADVSTTSTREDSADAGIEFKTSLKIETYCSQGDTRTVKMMYTIE